MMTQPTPEPVPPDGTQQKHTAFALFAGAAIALLFAITHVFDMLRMILNGYFGDIPGLLFKVVVSLVIAGAAGFFGKRFFDESKQSGAKYAEWIAGGGMNRFQAFHDERRRVSGEAMAGQMAAMQASVAAGGGQMLVPYPQRPPAQSAHDQYVDAQARPLLRPGELILDRGLLSKEPPLIVQIIVQIGFILRPLFFDYWLTAVTNQRLILIKTSFWGFKPSLSNQGVDSIEYANLTRLDFSSFASFTTLEFRMKNGYTRVLRVRPRFGGFAWQSAFASDMPSFIQRTLSMPAQAQALPQAPMPVQQQPMQAQSGVPASPSRGANVSVRWPDGSVYPGTVMDARDGSVLCAFPNGQQQWVPSTAVMAG